MKFWKMEACGNDFIMVLEEPGTDYSQMAKMLCPAHTAIGADGLIVVRPKPLTMIFYNADGSEGKMCGNGLRCFVWLCHLLGLDDHNYVKVQTLGGVMEGWVRGEELVEENFGQPILSCQEMGMHTLDATWLDKPISYTGKEAICSCLQVGALHCVTFNKPFETNDAKALHASPLFLDRMNVNFVEVQDRHNIILHTYERGVGWTLACGTGSAASSYITYKKGLVDKDVTVHEMMGDLHVSIKDDGIHLTGPARVVYVGYTEGETHA